MSLRSENRGVRTEMAPGAVNGFDRGLVVCDPVPIVPMIVSSWILLRSCLPSLCLACALPVYIGDTPATCLWHGKTVDRGL